MTNTVWLKTLAEKVKLDFLKGYWLTFSFS